MAILCCVAKNSFHGTDVHELSQKKISPDHVNIISLMWVKEKKGLFWGCGKATVYLGCSAA